MQQKYGAIWLIGKTTFHTSTPDNPILPLFAFPFSFLALPLAVVSPLVVLAFPLLFFTPVLLDFRLLLAFRHKIHQV